MSFFLALHATLAQVMASCLTVPSHYLNQCWLIINGVCGIHILKTMVASPKCQWINFQLPLLNYSHIRDMQLVWFLFITPVVFHKVSLLQHSGENEPSVTICIQDTTKHTNLCSMCLLFVHKGRLGKSHICTSRISDKPITMPGTYFLVHVIWFYYSQNVYGSYGG